MKKALRVILVSALLVSILSVFSFASSNSYYTFYYQDREITITAEDAQIIADYIAYGIIPAGYLVPGNELNTPLMCILFGHSTETVIAYETIHNVYTTSPKCVENKYSLEHCTRSNCDYIQSTLIYSHRIAYCHG